MTVRRAQLVLYGVFAAGALATWRADRWSWLAVGVGAVFGFGLNLALRRSSPQNEEAVPWLALIGLTFLLDMLVDEPLRHGPASVHVLLVAILMVAAAYRLADWLWPRPGVPRAF